MIGGLEPDYFMYWEETDWCVRARRAGFRCVVEPSATLVHERSTARPSASVTGLLRRNGLLFMRRNGSALTNITSFAYFCTLGLAWEIQVAFRTRRSPRSVVIATLGSVTWNLRDAWRRRSWRRPAVGPAISGERPG